MNAFERFSGALQYQIVNTLGWRELRPVQEQAAGALLEGKNCIVLAPTAGGKTEAAFFPLLSTMDVEDWRPASVLYLSPIRALINNLEGRLSYYAGLVGRRAFKWHGDVGPTERRRFLADPADILLTTPESLEAMMMSARVPAGRLFATLRAVVIDEIHAFAADDRGAHLSALLERLARLCGQDLQRIGLSATVGDPQAILDWVKGSSQRAGVVVDPGGESSPVELTLDYVGNLDNAARVIEALHPGRKRLVFVDSRRGAEELGKLLSRLDVLTHVSHGSLSASERRDAERAFAEGQDCVIVATSALELGIDVGDLDHVLQLDSPNSVASFLQRMGRTGRREGAARNCTFLATTDADLLQAAGIVTLFREGYVEPVQPKRRAAHILAHQVMGLAIQHSGLGRGDWWPWLDGAAAFCGLTAEERQGVVAHMLAQDILTDQEGRLWLGEDGERRFGRAGFRKLYAVFDTPRLILVRYHTREIGQVDAGFLRTLATGEPPTCFTLAGRPWQVLEIDWPRGICSVRPAPEGRAARWSGTPRFLSYKLCQTMRRILLGQDVEANLSRRAVTTLDMMRSEHAFLAESPAPLLDAPEGITWWTFAGGAANLLLARTLEAELHDQVTSRNTSLTITGQAGKSIAAVRQALRKLKEEARPTEEDALRLAAQSPRQGLSKFAPCLPEDLLQELMAGNLFDVDGAGRVLGEWG